MPEGWRYWTVTGLAALALLLAGVDALLQEGNRRLQVAVSTRSQYIQQSAQLEALGRDIIGAIANLAIQNKDEQLRGVLEAHGYRINQPAPSTPGSSGAAPPAKSR